MNSIGLFNRRVGYAAVGAVLIIAVMASALVSAAQVTGRSIALSSSSAAATNVTYSVNFKAVATAGAFVVDFCSNSPLIGQTCDAPAGFSAAGAASVTSGFTDVVAPTSGLTNQVVVTGVIAQNAEISVDLTGINNPTEADPLYARIVTYDTKASALEYTSTDLKTGNVDDGGVAISITPTISVSGSVLESLTFCMSAPNAEDENPITANCGGSLVAPTLKLGEQVGDMVALTADAISTGTIHTQISTNAASGAVIWLKSNAAGCGGLLRAGADPGTCDIKPALGAGITEGQALFGVRTSTATDTPATNASGELQPFLDSGYNNDTYALNFADGDASGVTSAFGDSFLDTAGAPANNKNMALTFGTSVSNDTPAGSYSADLSLIATGKF